MEMTDPNLTIVGHGRVGGSLAAAAERAGVAVGPGASAVLLCVPDDAIRQACEDLAGDVPDFVGHVSGACGLDALTAAGDRGSKLFSIHPLQTFPTSDTPIEGTPCAISADDPAAVELARDLAERLGMRPFEIPEQVRGEYHAAAAMASNFLIAIEEAAVELLARAGIDDGRELLSPLVLRSAANWSEQGGEALTGPIARGDRETIARHRDAIGRSWPELLDTYDMLAKITAKVASAKGARPE